MKNKFVIALALFLGLIFIVSSCDTRDDYFYEHCDEPVISLYSDNDTLIDGKKFINVDIYWGEEVAVNFDFTDIYGISNDNSFNYKIGNYQVGNMKTEGYYNTRDENGYAIICNNLSLDVDCQNNKIIFKENTFSAYQFFTDAQPYDMIQTSPVFSGQLELSIENILGKKGYVYINFKVLLNAPPTASILVEDINTNEKRIIVKASDIKDDEIIAYEYCIDGSVYMQYYGYEFEENNEKAKAGQAAYNGTYITSTSLSEIKHSFQTTGSHTIYVRCQDKHGCWSKWVSKTIII